MITFTASVGKKIDFGAGTAASNLSTMTVFAWVYPSSVDLAGRDLFGLDNNSASTDDGWRLGTEEVSGVARWWYESNNGVWYSTATTSDRLVVITHDRASTANDPVFYINGVSVSVTEYVAPSVTPAAGNAGLLKIGDVFDIAPINGDVFSCGVYNVILTASEIADAYNSRKAIPTLRGLVFAPDLRGAVGVDDGDTLGGTNYVRDIVSGATGTPSGSPVFYADNYLNWR